MTHTPTSSGTRILATDYVLGLMDSGARRKVDAQRAVDLALDGEIRQLEALLERTPINMSPDATAAHGLFARVLGRITEAAPSNPWQEIWPGVEKRNLWDERSYLFRCAPGAQIPAHQHACEERLVVLDGEVTIGDRKYTAGVCEVSPRNSFHDEAQADTDCLVLIQLGN